MEMEKFDRNDQVEEEEEEEEYMDIDTGIQICGTDQTMYG